MPTTREMTPELALTGIMLLREALAAMERGELAPGGLPILVQHACYPQQANEKDLEWAGSEMERIIGRPA